MSDKPLSLEEKICFEGCKKYYRLLRQPLISVADEVYGKKIDMPSSTSITFAIDKDCREFELGPFLNQICDEFNLKPNDIKVGKIQSAFNLKPYDLQMNQIQTESTIIQTDISNKFEYNGKKLFIKMIVDRINDKFEKMLCQMKVFFMFLGPIKSLLKRQQYRQEIRLNPKYNQVYGRRDMYWRGPCTDKKNRGGKPYYCPDGWQRWSFYVTRDFNAKFNGWCIGYHGTKFEHGLAILLSGLKPAERKEHGDGVYATPSINYACHPRYSEVKSIEPSSESKFFKAGKYVQFVLECRVHPKNIVKIGEETLHALDAIIDRNIGNRSIEWVVNSQGKDIVDFNDPNSSIVCTGLLLRVTDAHPALLPQSQWWFESHLCNDPNCCKIGIDLESLEKQRQNGDVSKIIII